MTMQDTGSLRLYHYWRSSSSWRVRWALALKGAECEMSHVHLLNGESESPEHLARHPLGFVPVLEVVSPSGASRFLTESMAIVEWIDETLPGHSILPVEPWERAQARELAELINADTQPLQNLAPQELHSADPEERKRWAVHWIQKGFAAYETLCSRLPGPFSMGTQPRLPDLFLVPQAYNALRYGILLSDYPRIAEIYSHALKTPTCKASHPDRYEPPAVK